MLGGKKGSRLEYREFNLKIGKLMRWQGRRESSNVEDRRSSGGGFGGGKPTGILGLIIILVGAYYGVDLSGLVGEMEVGTTQSSPLQSQQEDQLFKLSKKWCWATQRKCGRHTFPKITDNM